MRKYIFISILSINTFSGFGQYNFGPPLRQTDLNCHVNVNERPDQNFRNDIKRATFRILTNWENPGLCSATMINRNTGQNSLGQYFITSWHCFKENSSCGGSEFNFNNTITMAFNYQSPDDVTHVFTDNNDGQQYTIVRQVRLVDKVICVYGDFALCEILGGPIPAHFNPYYAGWQPDELFLNLSGPFAAIHHAGGSIKKISGVNTVSVQSGSKITCRVITKIIDFLFGWIWGRRWSTQVICTYGQFPWYGTKYKAAGYQFGKMEGGSSGSGLFTGGNKFVGNLSASFPEHGCGFIDPGVDYYGKFADNYYRQTIKNTLNPPNKYWIDQAGIPGRQISCYPQLSINAEAPSGFFNLYPASLYQADNDMTLSSQTTFTTNGVVRVMDGARFTFQAGSAVSLNPGFEARPGSIFQAVVTGTPCFINNNTYKNNATEESGEYETPDMNEVLANLPYPEEKVFDISKYIKEEKKERVENVNKLRVYPNPSNGVIQVEIFFNEKENHPVLTIYDLNGKPVYTKQYSNQYFIRESLQLPLQNGMYNVTITTSKGIESKKLIIFR